MKYTEIWASGECLCSPVYKNDPVLFPQRRLRAVAATSRVRTAPSPALTGPPSTPTVLLANGPSRWPAETPSPLTLWTLSWSVPLPSMAVQVVTSWSSLMEMTATARKITLITCIWYDVNLHDNPSPYSTTYEYEVSKQCTCIQKQMTTFFQIG